MSGDACEVDRPNPFQKLLYLCGVRAPEAHRAWVEGVVAGSGTWRNLLLALPNALIILGVGILSLATGDRVLGTMMLVGSVAVLAVGAVFESLAQRRARWLAARHRAA